jgi:hypothetical protein
LLENKRKVDEKNGKFLSIFLVSRIFFIGKIKLFFISRVEAFNKLLDGSQCKLMKKSMKLKFMNSMEKLLINQLNEQKFKNDWKRCNLCEGFKIFLLLVF